MKKFLLIPLILLLSACSIEPNTPQHAVEKALSALQEKNVDQFNRYSNSTLYDYILHTDNFIPNKEMSSNEANFYQTLVPYLQAFDYTITDTYIEDKNAIVSIQFIYYDINACLQAIQPIVMQQLKDYNAQTLDEYYTYMSQEFLNNIENFKTKTIDKSIKVRRKNHQWRLDIDDPSAFIYYLYAHN